MRGADKMQEPVPGPFGDQPLLTAMARRCLRAGPTRVVLGPDQDTRRALLEGLDVDVLEAPEGAGMAASIVTGVDGLDTPVLVVLADMPDVTAADLHLMIALSAQAPEAILRAASEDGTPGHPVLFPADLLPELAVLTGDTGAREVLTRHGRGCIWCRWRGDRALVDLDTPEDWADWRARQHAIAVDAGGNEFLADEVHPVRQRRDPGDVGGPVVGHKLHERDRAGNQRDGLPVEPAEPAIDPPRRLLDLVLDVLVDGHVAIGRDRHVHEAHLADEIGVRLEHTLEAGQLLGAALGVVGSPDRQDQLGVAEFLRDPRRERLGLFGPRAFSSM
jgi:molybdenum cofactor cytidylyltransferase